MGVLLFQRCCVRMRAVWKLFEVLGCHATQKRKRRNFLRRFNQKCHAVHPYTIAQNLVDLV